MGEVAHRGIVPPTRSSLEVDQPTDEGADQLATYESRLALLRDRWGYAVGRFSTSNPEVKLLERRVAIFERVLQAGYAEQLVQQAAGQTDGVVIDLRERTETPQEIPLQTS